MGKKVVYGIHIYLRNGITPMADLAIGEGGLPNGEIVTVRWDIPAERDNYIINAYTLIWDERPLRFGIDSFASYIEGGSN